MKKRGGKLIHTIVATKNSGLIENVPIDKLDDSDIEWYWMDFELPSEEEIALLSAYFRFHHLAIQNCVDDILERPKVEHYDTCNFFVLHALNQKNCEPAEFELFVGKNYVVSFCKTTIPEINMVRQSIINNSILKSDGHLFITCEIFNKVVDFYCLAVYKIEDYLDQIEVTSKDIKENELIDEIFDIRTELMKLRRIINPMKELLYTIVTTQYLNDFLKKKFHFRDIYARMLRIWDIIESSREVTADIRDNYLSINSHRMNKIINTLTIISSIFIPLTFVVGIYGMNFDYMPELRWKYGYFFIMGIMASIVIGMIFFFKRKGWFSAKK